MGDVEEGFLDISAYLCLSRKIESSWKLEVGSWIGIGGGDGDGPAIQVSGLICTQIYSTRRIIAHTVRKTRDLVSLTLIFVP